MFNHQIKKVTFNFKLNVLVFRFRNKVCILLQGNTTDKRLAD